jgi:hypothetical protein
MSTKKLTKEEFIKKALVIHGKKYDYTESKYINSRTKLEIICKEHGNFLQTPHSHLSKNGCPKCGKISSSCTPTLTINNFVEKANTKHNSLYFYDKVEYKNSKTKIVILCSKHGEFLQEPRHHLQGQGCPKCANQEKGYSKEDFIKQAKGKICTLYILNCFNERENFYKVGITKHSVKIRYSTIKRMPYTYTIVSKIYGSAKDICKLEELEKKRLKDYKYQPKIKFGGSKTECFTKI